MIRIALLMVLVLVAASDVEARRSLMDDVMQRPSQYTENRQRLDRARTDFRIQMMELRLERERLLNERLRRQQQPMPYRQEPANRYYRW